MRKAARQVAVRARATTDEVHVRRLLHRLAPLLPSADTSATPREIAILARTDERELLAPWLRRFADDHVQVFFQAPARVRTPAAAGRGSVTEHVARTAADVAELLHEVGTVDLLVDLRPASIPRYTRTWAAVALHVRQGGIYLLRPGDLRWSHASQVLVAWAALLGGAEQVQLDKVIPRPRGLDPEVTGGILMFPEGLAVTKRHDHLLFVRDEHVQAVVRRERGLRLDVLDELPPGTLHAKSKITSHESDRPVGGLLEQMPYPALQVRHYRGRIEFSGQTLLVAGHSILPDSHRFFRMPSINHPLTTNWPGDERFATRPEPARPKEVLPGNYYLLDPQFTGHYGHLLTEAVPRLWGWDLAKERLPDLKVLTKVKPGRVAEPVLDRLLSAYGVDPADVVYVDHPVELESVVTTGAMWHNFEPHFAHPDILRIWRRIADRLVDPTAPQWDRIFLTRRPGSFRTCHNAPEVEALFEAHGFQILRPEEFDLGVQAGFFRTAKVIAGFAGSQMFNMMYTTDLQQLIVLAQESYTARNEHLYGALLARNEDWFWSKPDRPWFHADWSFDFERNSPALEKLLAAL